jgi:hypothetical protein
VIRILIATPIILTGKALTHLGYRVAEASHLDPWKRVHHP